MNDIRFGFLGAGFIASAALGPAVHRAEGAELFAAGASEVARAEKLEPTGRAYDSYLAVVDDPNVDAIYISLTNDQHLPWIRRALEAGKDVLCEKPLCLDADQTRTAFQLARDHDRLLVEAMWHRWHPRTQRAAELVGMGALGQIRQVSARFAFGGLAPSNFRLDPSRGGGALYDVGCYTVAAAGWGLAGPLSVTEASFDEGATGVDLGVEATLDNGVGQARLSASIASADEQHLSIAGSDGELSFVDDAFTSWRAACSLAVISDGQTQLQSFAPVDGYQIMVEAFVRRIRGEPVFVVEPHESIAQAHTLDIIRASARQVLHGRQ